MGPEISEISNSTAMAFKNRSKIESWWVLRQPIRGELAQTRAQTYQHSGPKPPECAARTLIMGGYQRRQGVTG